MGFKSFNRRGEAVGQIFGGNLTLINHLIGTSSFLGFKNKILVIEEIGEYPYHIDRLLVQLLRTGELGQLSGLVVGDFSDIQAEDFGLSIEEIILERTKKIEIPVAFGFNFGHEKKNNSLRFGETYQLTVSKGGSTLESHVAV